MLPVARSGAFFIPGGLRQYLIRRSRRILPPYYAALGLSLALIACVPALNHPEWGRWLVALPAFDLDVVISHLCLVHSFLPQWTQKINPPMWSVGVEWWIYFLFPIVLLPLWRLVGMYCTLGIITIATVATHWLPGQPCDFFYPWYFALFGFGAAGAFINFSPAAERERHWNWAWLSTLGLSTSALLFTCTRGWVVRRLYATDILVGLSVAIFIIWCSKEAQTAGTPHGIVRILESRLVLWLGNLSYSLYLTHEPVIALFSPMIRATGWSAECRFYAHILTGIIASLPVAYIFHLIFERPFMAGHPKSPTKVALSAAVDPAP